MLSLHIMKSFNWFSIIYSLIYKVWYSIIMRKFYKS